MVVPSTVPLGPMTFRGTGVVAAVGTTEGDAATHQVVTAWGHGVNPLNTSTMYSDGTFEEILAQGRRTTNQM